MGRAPRLLLSALTVLYLSCGHADVQEPDGGADSDTRLGPDGDGRDTEVEDRGGPVTIIGRDVTVITDRLCDLDGDGINDNVIADLGESLSGIFVMAVNTMVLRTVDVGPRVLVHLPWIDDLSVPEDTETVMIAFDGDDTDVPPDPSDDFSG
jgi:hypothetical protein